jgi:hypothetical protein
MTLILSTYPNIDDATKKRTEQFFLSVGAEEIADAALLRLVNQGIYLEARNNEGDTALTRAAWKGRTETAQALLAAGANIEARNVYAATALTWAAWNGHTETVQALLAAGANIEARDVYAATALTWAAWNGHTETVQALLAAGANIGARANNDMTALIWAAHEGHTQTVQALLAVGANIEARNNDGDSALIIEKNDAIKELLNHSRWHASYADFVAHGTAPESPEKIYHLLAVIPLVDSRAPVDYEGNIRKIFAHAQWENKEQAADILKQMQGDGRINAESVDSILDSTFPERSASLPSARDRQEAQAGPEAGRRVSNADLPDVRERLYQAGDGAQRGAAREPNG